MAEEKNGGPMRDLLMFLGALAILVMAWFISGGPERADLRGLFLDPLPPLGTGEAYGPEIGQPAPWTPEN